MADDHADVLADAELGADAGADAELGADAVDSRLERLRTTQAWGSLLSVQEFAAVAGAGFDPVGQVLGTAVIHVGFAAQGGRCSGTVSYTPRTDLASATTGPFNTLLRKRYGVRRLALSRAVQECVALGGDGIVGVTLTITSFPAGGTEFTVAGTAVRARSTIRPAAPFTSHLSGQGFASLLQAGWVPVELVFGVSLGARHDDMRTRRQTRWTAASRDIRSYSELVKDTRRDARDQLAQAVAAQGADGVVVDELTLHIGERECPTNEGGHDHTAEATILGTSIACFDPSAGARGRTPLTMMRLNPSPADPFDPAPGPGTVPVLAQADSPERPESDMPEEGFFDRHLAARAAKRASRSTFASSDPSAISRKD
jgi:uncharacterized protein YbjQ (UPF0145 family)